jgi:hypothetical protein
MPTPSPTQNEVFDVLQAFILDVCPVTSPAWQAWLADNNRVSAPRVGNYVMMSPLRVPRLRTNIASDQDCKFTGSIAGTVLTVTELASGVIRAGATLFGTGVTTNTKIVSGPGGVGSYVIDTSQTVSSRVLSAGARSVEQGAEFVVQLDFHSDDTSAVDAANAFSTLFRDPYGVDFFEAYAVANGKPVVVPLYGDDPKQMPFINENQQWEWRWVIEAHLQVNETVVVPQQYADIITPVPVSVEAEFPA